MDLILSVTQMRSQGCAQDPWAKVEAMCSSFFPYGWEKLGYSHGPHELLRKKSQAPPTQAWLRPLPLQHPGVGYRL